MDIKDIIDKVNVNNILKFGSDSYDEYFAAYMYEDNYFNLGSELLDIDEYNTLMSYLGKVAKNG